MNLSRFASIALLFIGLSPQAALAAPGDILFQDDFESNLSQWSVTSGGGNAGIGNETANSGTRSARLRWDTVSLTSDAFNATVPAAELSLWVRRGDDSFSEDPDTDEDLVVEYLDQSGSWIVLETFPGSGTPGEIITPTYSLTGTALHSALQIRLRYLQGNGANFDYWHVDDVVVTEVAPNLISGLIGDWRFDELVWNGSNDEVLDVSGNDLHLTAFDAATTNVNPAIAGDPGTCSYGVFNGSVSFIQRDDDLSTADSLLDIPNTLTITTWINTNVIPSSGLKSIVSKDENYEFHINSSGEIYWWWRWATLTTSGLNLQTNRWYHVAITWQSGEQIIYVDGVPRATSTRTGTLDINNDPLQIGQDLDIPERFFDGFIDEVRIYENVLTNAEITQVMNETHPCISGGVCSLSYIDEFSVPSYSNNDGVDPWANNWTETGDDGSPTSGKIQINGGQLVMTNSIGNNTAPTLQREADTSGAIAASLTVALSTSGTLENGDRFDVSVSANGGASWTVLQNFSNDFNNTFNYDITAFASTTFRLRFRVNQGYRSSGEFITIDDVSISTTKNCGPDHFRLVHDGNGINCLREAITLRAEDSANNLVTDYAGLVSLNLSGTNGNWFVDDGSGFSSDPAQGSLADTAGDNDGNATYQFAATDGGSVVLYLEDTVAESTNIGVTDGVVSDENTEGNIIFRPFGFVFSPNPIVTQIAGRPFDLTLTAAGQTPAQLECGVIEEYTGIKTVNFWSDYTAPVTSPTQVAVDGIAIATTEAGSVPQNVAFTSGIATISVAYDDVGQIAISAKDEIDIGEPPSDTGDEIIGGISPFVVRPFGYDIEITGDPYADDGNDGVFTVAGDDFTMRVRSVLWQAADDADNNGVPDEFTDTDNDGIPDSGGDLSDNAATPNLSQINDPAWNNTISLSPIALVVNNANGALATTSLDFASFPAPLDASAGEFELLQNWSEVGILQIDASTANFMGTGQSVSGRRINIGRFIPADFNLVAPLMSAQCGGFTYAGFFDGVNPGLDKSGQLFDLAASITARNRSGAITRNYANDFAKLSSADFILQPYDVAATADATGRINSTALALNFVNGTSNYAFTDADYQYDTLAAPFDMRVDLTATDSDGVTSGTISSNAIEQRLGRARLIDSYGPEIADLEIPLQTEYFDGTNWLLNTADNCTRYIRGDISVVPGTFTENLSPGDSGSIAPTNFQILSNGKSAIANGFWVRAPGQNNYGSVITQFDISSQPWLSFDWDADNSVDNPTALVSFGYYRGSDRVIYWREVDF